MAEGLNRCQFFELLSSGRAGCTASRPIHRDTARKHEARGGGRTAVSAEAGVSVSRNRGYYTRLSVTMVAAKDTKMKQTQLNIGILPMGKGNLAGSLARAPRLL